jgi:BirA family biotin operon repressor/biotin-[acetyl-CoA-carboxylase] ligase
VVSVTYIHFDRLDSTNTWTKTHAHELARDRLTCVTAKEQTAGVGRFKRHWFSPKGNLYASLFFTIPLQTPYLPNIGQTLAYSCATLLQEKGFPIKIKWPNDLLIHQKKVAGILTETLDLTDVLGVILGLGLNLKLNEEALASINQPVTSLAEFSKENLNVKDVLASLIPIFLKNLDILRKKGFASFQKDFENYLAYKGEEVTLNIKNEQLKGICQGVAEDGRLQLLLPSGERLLFWS